MKFKITLFTTLFIPAGIIAQNTFPSSGNVGIGTASPQTQLHIQGNGASAFAFIEKQSSSYECGLTFRKAGNTMFYLYSDNTDDALKMQSTGVAGENDDNPRFMMPLATKDIFMGLSGGNIGIGTRDTRGYRLAVNGSAIFTRATVKLAANWPDYVFDPAYQLPSLQYVESYIKTNKHLPGIPAAAEVEKNGLDLGENQAALLKKVEELTLYVIELKKEIEALKKKN